MKQKLIYGGVFLLAFLLVTIGIFYLNSVYKNIFLLDFSQKQVLSKPQTQDSLKTQNVAIDSSKMDSTKILQANSVQPDSALLTDSTKISQVPAKDSVIQNQVVLKEEKPIVKNQPLIKPDKSTKLDKSTKTDKSIKPDTSQPKEAPVIETSYHDPKDTNYIKWTKKTAGMFESMDPKKAAKIIEKYSDNIARDIIYGMKKQKAAEILAELSPDIASRIARMP